MPLCLRYIDGDRRTINSSTFFRNEGWKGKMKDGLLGGSMRCLVASNDTQLSRQNAQQGTRRLLLVDEIFAIIQELSILFPILWSFQSPIIVEHQFKMRFKMFA